MLTGLLLIVASGATIQATNAVVPDGRRLQPYEACYTVNMTRDGQSQPIGIAYQAVRRGVSDGRAVLNIVVHQRVGDQFDMRDTFVLDGETLRPLRLENMRHGKPHISVVYNADRITGERREPDGSSTPIDVILDEPVWEGNLYGPTFAALPLARDARFTLPYWQYDRGFGQFTVSVVGEETVATVDGPVEAWVLEAGSSAEQRLTYRVAKMGGRELGYSAGPGSQTLGGDCTALVGSVSAADVD